MIQISLVIVGLCKIVTVSGGYSGGYLSYDFNNGLIGGHLNCNTSATISCKFAVNTPLITWRIAQTIEDSSPLAAQCYLFSCFVNPKFLPNYKFTYDQSTGVTNVTIKAVTFEHANLEFRCDDGSQPKPFKPSVAVPPEQHLTEVSNNTIEDYTELSIHIPCIYPTDSVNITWYSKTMNGTNRKKENESKRTVRPCTTSSVCIMAKKSSRIESILHIPKHKDGQRRKRRSTGSVQERTFEVLVEHASGSFVIGVGNYSVTDNETSINNTDSGITQKPTSPDQNQTDTILFIVIPVVVVFAVLCVCAVGFYIKRKSFFSNETLHKNRKDNDDNNASVRLSKISIGSKQ